jgi:RNA polymerase sigma factor (TIGR02999 family)
MIGPPRTSAANPVEREITQLLQEAASGEQAALDAVAERVYSELERLAARQMRAQFGPGLAGVTLEPAALVNETFLKLLREPRSFENRRHFFAFTTRAMQRALIDYHRARSAAKRGGDQVRVTLTGLVRGEVDATASVLDVDAVLEELERLDERKAEVVRLRVFWGMEMAEIAQVLEVSLATVERDWRFARNWMATALADRAEAAP